MTVSIRRARAGDVLALAELRMANLIAPILAPNTQAVDFHAPAGFGSHGVILLKDLATEGGEDR